MHLRAAYTSGPDWCNRRSHSASITRNPRGISIFVAEGTQVWPRCPRGTNVQPTPSFNHRFWCPVPPPYAQGRRLTTLGGCWKGYFGEDKRDWVQLCFESSLTMFSPCALVSTTLLALVVSGSANPIQLFFEEYYSTTWMNGRYLSVF